MKVEQKQAQQQTLVLTQEMRQSLKCLLLSAVELNEYAEELFLSNPLLEVQTSSPVEVPLQRLVSWEQWPVQFRTRSDSAGSAGGTEVADFSTFLTRGTTFREYLIEQLGQMRLVDQEMYSLCYFLVGCLDGRGYLDIPLTELAKWANRSVSEIEQALYIIQMLDPPGVGARNLSECLVLQLAQSEHFNSLTLAIAQSGMDLLPRRDIREIARRYGVTPEAARDAAAVICAMNPIPSRGFFDGDSVPYIAPDAVVHREGSRLIVEINESVLPRLSINAEYIAMLETSIDAQTRQYIQDRMAEAKSVIRGLRSRSDTLFRLITAVVDIQHEYFLGGALVPLTMQQIADRMHLSISTVSRAVRGKFIQFGGEILSLRSFFTAAVPVAGYVISAQTVKMQIRHLILGESSDNPLSDEEIRTILSGRGIDISRRVIAKYRSAMGFENASRRRR